MKKVLGMILCLCMVFGLAACGGGESGGSAAVEAEYNLGMGVVLDTDSSKTELAQVDATIAAVVTDADGKIVSCRIDCVQDKMEVVGGAVDAAKTFKTKMELGDDYGMVAYGNAIAEWDAQAKAFEEYVVDKTGEEVAAIETTTNDHGYAVAADEALYAGCTMQITDFVEAVVKACADEKGQSFTTADTFTLGVAAISDASESTAAADGNDAVVKMYSEYAAAVVGADGTILAAVNDATQPKINVNASGEIVSAEYKATKRELGSDYGMVAYGNAVAEWDAQSDAFSKYVVGKTAEEVAAIETTTNDHGYAVAVDEALYAGCTMQISGMMEVVAQAANYAR